MLRECLKCNGTDDALMTRQEDNERTLVMSRWFHCIKLPPDVLAADHPFHALFAGEDPGHLFFARRDGSARQDLTGEQSRTELWERMESYLDSDYEKGVDAALVGLLRLLDRFDRVDVAIGDTRERIDDLLEKGQVDSAKMRKQRETLRDLEKERTELRAEAVRLSRRELRPSAAPAKG